MREAADGPAALRLIYSGEGIDLLFTDLMLPGGIEGPVLLAQARRRIHGLRALLTSGHVERFDPATLSDPVLRKPYGVRTLAQAIRQVLDKPDDRRSRDR